MSAKTSAQLPAHDQPAAGGQLPAGGQLAAGGQSLAGGQLPAGGQSLASDRPTARERPTARDRLLAAADELFYEGGVHTVGIDRVIERAGVAKATLYSVFGSKDELIRSYLTARQLARKQRITRGLARYDNPRDRLLGVFDVLGESIAQPGFRGCAFVNASAEARPGSAAVQVSGESRAWLRGLLAELGQAAGAKDADRLARQLELLYDGASVAGNMDRDPAAAAAAREAAAILLDAAAAH